MGEWENDKNTWLRRLLAFRDLFLERQYVLKHAEG